MVVSLKHATVVAIPDDPAFPVGSDEYNAEHATSMATNKLLGRGTAGAGAFEEITIGTNLSLTGTTLSAIGGGGGGGSGTVDWVNVKDHGAVGDGVHDDTAGIQAAIDFALANLIQAVYLPSGKYKTTSTLYLDPPVNMRAHGDTSVTTFAFSLNFFGDGQGNAEQIGTSILPTTNTIPCILVGPGQNMMISNFQIKGPGGLYRGNMPPSGVKGTASNAAIGYTGFNGATVSLTSNCQIENFYYAFKTGWSGDGLNDSNTWVKCRVYNCAVGWWIAQTQNFANSLYDCVAGGVTTCVLNTNGGGLHVFGGNMAASDSVGNSLAASAISALTVVDVFSGQYTLTATLVPDANIPNIYGAFTFETTHFGIVPATMTAWNAGTNQATFKLLQEWVSSNFAGVNIKTVTQIEAELQAQTKVFGCEFPIVFQGCGISVYGMHNEMSQEGPERLIQTDVTFGAAKPSILSQININHDPNCIDCLPLTTDTLKAKYYAAQTFSFIKVNSAPVSILDSQMGCAGTVGFDPVLIDVTPNNFPFVVERCNNCFFNLRSAGIGINFLDFPSAKFDGPYCQFRTSRQDYDNIWNQQQQSPFWGIRPAVWCSPGLIPSDITTLSGVLPALGVNACSYAAGIWGGQIYQITQFQYSAITNHRFVSNHHFMTYGQDITPANTGGTCAWHYRGQSSVVYMDANSLKMMKQGLGIKLNDGTSDVLYMVIGIFPGLGYVQVENKSGGPPLTSGAKTVDVTGTTIKQEPYAITQIP